MTLSDELLTQIATATGRCYPHEGKSMATELLEWRRRAKEAAAKAATAPAQVSTWPPPQYVPGQPYPPP